MARPVAIRAGVPGVQPDGAALDPDLQALLREQNALLGALARDVAEILRHVRRERRPALDNVPELMSVAQAAKVLGRSRTRTLRPAVARGEIRMVTVGARQLIPKSEVVRVAEEGLRERGAPARRRPTRPPARGVGDRIRSLPLPT
jgi:excisionase family DNA binding protein